MVCKHVAGVDGFVMSVDAPLEDTLQWRERMHQDVSEVLL